MKRSDNVARLSEPYEVLVIGGGATGLGVAVDSAARGYRTLLVEARDFAQGTSSRSTKLVHGGVRYLRQGNISLVREALFERAILLQNAPHLAEELRFLVPATLWWEKPFYTAGLKAYDLLAGRHNLTPSRPVGARAARDLVPTLTPDARGGVLYSDGQFDDARLAITLARTAADLGAVLVNDAPVSALVKENGRLAGAVVTDGQTGREYRILARAVVNATGVFTDAIRRMDDPQAPPVVAASQGVHIVLPRRFLPGETAIMVPRTADGRVVFLIPWQGVVVAGTTDTPVQTADAEPRAREEEIDFILEHAAHYLAEKPGRADILSVFAGLRPLVKGEADHTAALSRDHTLLESPSGLLTITGGKWTTYRRMAQDTVDRAARVAGLPERPCPTATLRLAGADALAGPWRAFGATPAEATSYEARFPGMLHPRLPYRAAMAAYAIEREMPNKVEDVLARRLRALLLDARAAVEAAPKVAELMACLQGRNAAWAAREVEDFARLAERYQASPSR